MRPVRAPTPALLHLHSNLPECLTELPAPPEPTLDSLAQTWFGTA
jgi:hygromycin-B 7''-O-kinase